MNLSDLPIDIILIIADFLEYSWELNAFAQTSRFFYPLLSDHIYEHNVRYFNGSILTWTSKHGSELVARKAIDAGADTMTSHDGKQTAMVLAAKHGHAAIFRLFLETGKIPTHVLTEWYSIRANYNPLIRLLYGGNSMTRRLMRQDGVIWRFCNSYSAFGQVWACRLLPDILVRGRICIPVCQRLPKEVTLSVFDGCSHVERVRMKAQKIRTPWKDIRFIRLLQKGTWRLRVSR